VAAHAKVSVLVLGTLGWDLLNPGKNANPNAYEREGHDRTSLALPPNQYRSAAALAPSRTGTPLLCVLMHGGSLQLGSLLADCTAIVDAWFPGQQGGAGLSDVVFGVTNPSGRSPQTYYSSDDELPPLGNMDLYAKKGTTYRYYFGKPDIPFGFGLSYSSFKYKGLVLNATRIGHCDSVSVSVVVTNVGDVDGHEVVQLYVTQPAATVKAPRVRLGDFARVFIAAGSSVTVSLLLTPKYHAVVLDEGNTSFFHPSIAVEAGAIGVHVGGGQPGFATGVLHANVTVTTGGPLTTFYQCA
jgi:beta-glucosidase